MNKQIYIYILAAMTACLMSCQDDFGYDPSIADGSKTRIGVSVEYNVEESLDLKSRSYYDDETSGGDSGTAIQNINDLWLAIYDGEGNFMCKYPIVAEAGASKSGPAAEDFIVDEATIKNQVNSDNRLPDESHLGDDKAGKVSFDIVMPTGKYYIYAIANVADFDKLDVSTRENLKATKFNWNLTDISQNSQMFGVFSAGGANRAQTDAAPITVTNRTASLHAWVRRLASKVTVAFDGSHLYDNVQVIIYDITIKDIPKQAYLGYDNHPGWSGDVRDTQEEPLTSEASAQRYTLENGLYPEGKKIKIQDELSSAELTDLFPTNYLHICNGAHKYLGKGEEGDNPSIEENTHSHTSRSLFFYENMQGHGKSKAQPNPEDSTEIWYPIPSEDDLTSGWKDHKPYGTYIEVTGYYRNSSNTAFVSSGPIKYRFMLGQDTDTDYDAIRNTHYKLTLVLKGNGNDADWHIEYKDKVGLHASSPQFISYLYNKDMNLTVKMSGELSDSYYLRAEIIGCDDNEIKYPHGKPSSSIADPTFRTLFYQNDKLDEQTYWRPWGDNTENYPDPSDHKDPQTPTEDLYYHGNPTVPNNASKPYYGPWVSFLSLRKTELLQITAEDVGLKTVEGSDNGDWLKMYTVNHSYFNNKNRGWRNYKVTEGTQTDPTDGNYNVKITKYSAAGVPNERIFTIPLFTRSKELYTVSGFTGNNPYTAYPRKQRVKIYVASDESGTAVEGIEPVYVDIIQVRRIVNPKAVWRSGETKPEDFHVSLMWLKNDNELDPNVEFEKFNSMGPWSAEVVTGGDNIISLSSTTDGSGSNASQSGVRRVEGASEHPVDFKINFNGNKGCAIVRVRYHNYTCEHDIFCRVGYDPLPLGSGKSLWQTMNVESFDKDGNAVLCKSPLMEGSLFKHNSTTAILSKNNTIDQFAIMPGVLRVKEKGSSETSKEWKNITPSYTDKYWTINNTGEYVATWTDFTYLMATTGSSSIKKAYGVLYGDGATETATTTGEAYGYNKTNDDADYSSTRGMRGVIVYDKDSHAQIFFPIGQSGYGRRKASGGWGNSDYSGALKYGNRSVYYAPAANLQYVPLFNDIYRRTGAIYWTRYCKGEHNASNNTAFDMNYHTMGFKTFSYNATNAGTADADGGVGDACFLRTLVGTPPEENF